MGAQSYSYKTTIAEAVPPAGTVVMPYPLADASSGNVDQANAQVVVGNQAYSAEDSQIEFDQETGTITITNHTAVAWPPQTDIVVVVPRDAQTADDVREVLLDHEQRITALEEAP